MCIVCVNKIDKERMKDKSFRKVLATILVLAVLSAMLLVSACCNKEDKLGTLSGNVVLINDTGNSQLDPIDYAGVTISLYKLAEPDTAVVRINQQHPYLGVIVQQEMYFDHRYQQPVLSVSSEPDGSFKLVKINPGSYNLVAKKDGWGYAYLYALDISEGANTLGKDTCNDKTPKGLAKTKSDSGKETITLYPERQLSGFGTSDLVFLTSRHYVVTDDFAVMPGTQVKFERNTTIRINPHKELVLYSNLECPAPGGGFFRIISNDKTAVADTLTPFQRIRIAEAVGLQPQVFRNAIIRDSYSGVVSNSSGLTVSRCFISSRQTAVSIYNTTDNQIVNCVLCDGKNSSFGAAMNDGSPSAIIQNNIIVKNSLGIFIRNSVDVEVSNNYFTNCGMGLLNQMDVNTSVMNNTFSDCTVGIRNANRAMMYAYNNEFQVMSGICNERDTGTSATAGITQFQANNNNFRCETWNVYAAKIQGMPTFSLDCTNNYWETADQAAIRQKIFDSQNSSSNATVFFIPYRNGKVLNAGVQPL